MKRGRNNLYFVLSVCIFAFIFIFLAIYLYGKEVDRRVNERLSDNVVYKTEVVSDSGIAEVNTNNDNSVEVLNEDQKIKQVQTYSNAIKIPKINVVAYVSDGVSREDLAYGFGRYTDSAELGAKGNAVVAGHSSNIYNCLLNGLESSIEYMDKIVVWDKSGKKYNYYVLGTDVVEPDDFSIFDFNHNGDRQLTLFTCTDEGRKRFVVYAYTLPKDLVKLYNNSDVLSEYSSMLEKVNSYTQERITMELKHNLTDITQLLDD